MTLKNQWLKKIYQCSGKWIKWFNSPSPCRKILCKLKQRLNLKENVLRGWRSQWTVIFNIISFLSYIHLKWFFEIKKFNISILKGRKMLRIFGRSTVRIQESFRNMQRLWKSWLRFTGVSSSKRGCIGVERLCWSTSGKDWRNALRKTKDEFKGKLQCFCKFKDLTLHGNKMDTESICYLHFCW